MTAAKARGERLRITAVQTDVPPEHGCFVHFLF